MTVLATSTPIIIAKRETFEDGENLRSNLAQVLCIWYPINFQKKFVIMSALFDLGNKINAIYPIFAKELELPIRPMDVGI